MRIFGFAGWSGSGKTTLIERIVPRLVARGLVVSLVKHAHHDLEIDQPGKDSFRHRAAGCTEVLVSSTSRWALIHELRGDPELTLDERDRDGCRRVTLCSLKATRRYPIPKLEVWRAQVGKPLLHPRDPRILAVATDSPDGLPDEAQRRLPVFALSDVDAIATFVDGSRYRRSARRLTYEGAARSLNSSSAALPKRVRARDFARLAKRAVDRRYALFKR